MFPLERFLGSALTSWFLCGGKRLPWAGYGPMRTGYDALPLRRQECPQLCAELSVLAPEQLASTRPQQARPGTGGSVPGGRRPEAQPLLAVRSGGAPGLHVLVERRLPRLVHRPAPGAPPPAPPAPPAPGRPPGSPRRSLAPRGPAAAP